MLGDNELYPGHQISQLQSSNTLLQDLSSGSSLMMTFYTVPQESLTDELPEEIRWVMWSSPLFSRSRSLPDRRTVAAGMGQLLPVGGVAGDCGRRAEISLSLVMAAVTSGPSTLSLTSPEEYQEEAERQN